MNKQTILLEISREDALRIGLLCCEHCNWPPNNHFGFEPFKCAHDSMCPGYKERARIGKIVPRGQWQ